MQASRRAPARKRTVSTGVKLVEQVARTLITLGGIGTVAAVTLIFVFLAWVVVPLFVGPSLEPGKAFAADVAASPIRLLVDPHRLLLAEVLPDGTVRVRRLADGALVREVRLFGEDRPTAARVAAAGGRAAFGFADGSVVVGTLAFDVEFLERDTPGLEGLAPGETRDHEDGVVSLTPIGQLRLSRLSIDLGERQPLGVESPVRLIDYVAAGAAQAFAALTDDGRLAIYKLRERTNLSTGKTSVALKEQPLPYVRDPMRGPPAHLFLASGADNLLLVWDDGRLERYDARPTHAPALAEVLDVVEDQAARVTAIELMLGAATLVVGDSAGRLRAWFRIKPEGTSTVDGSYLVPGHELATSGAAITSLAPSPRSRLLAAGSSDGSVRLFYVTAESLLAEVASGAGEAVRALSMTPREDGLVARVGDELRAWSMQPGHPEASPKALFGKLAYEGYETREHVWQSSGGTDAFEPKLGLVPLIYGTVKATLYSMLFGIPLALLAAVYTSEFMHKKWRNPVKSTIEMMASLPSVVLGFLAAVVFAPYVEAALPAVLASFLTVPLAFLCGAYLWQLVPDARARRLAGKPKAAALTLALPVGIALAALCGPWIEAWLFAGDIKAWLDGQVGAGTGGWVLILLPLGGFVTFVVMERMLRARLRSASRAWSHRACASFDLVRFVGGAVLAVALTVLTGATLDAAGLDPRDLFLGTYVQRNALIVGFVMGFAVIPILYTIAEDALSSVPEHLRLASLGAGATPWQTAVRIVIPTAMSGLFSAVMIGLGRAVGETMIVLMATGNTAVMDPNPFNGFRTLSANIAVELPEAVRNSTHYRTLFLAALTLFAMTFALNTLAEAVRQRFRKRAFEL